MIDRPTDQIDHKDLLSLIDNKVKESRYIEYKRTLNASSDREKHQFLSAVTAFANTDGGDLLFGVHAEAGIPIAISSIGEPNEDEVRLKLENLCRDGIDPKLSSVALHFIAVDGGKALLVRVQKSLQAPHRVILGGSGHFYGRNSAGKFQMDVNELRTAFTNSASLADHLTEYRQQRVTAIFNHDTPIAIQRGCAMIFHVVPLSALSGTVSIDLATHKYKLHDFHPLGRNSYQNSKVTLRGWTNYTNLTDGRTHAYTTVTRRGEIEAVAVFTEIGGSKIIHSERLKEYMIEGAKRYLPLLQELGLESPYYLLLSFADISGYSLLVPYDNGVGYTLHETTEPYAMVHLPEIYVTDTSRPAEDMLRSLIDMAWNLFGLSGESQ